MPRSPEAMADPELLQLAKDEPTGVAFRAFYERHQVGVFRYLVAMLGDHAFAEDVLQETFFKIYTRLHLYDGRDDARAWVFRIAKNNALNALRKRRKLGGFKGLQAAHGVRAAGAEGVAEQVARSEQEQLTQIALAALDLETRSLLLQRHGAQMTHKEIARSSNCSERTVRYRLKAAYASLLSSLLGNDALKESE
jgi:RNA polymerase sigma-70 factor (ECF subfamily)